MQQGERRQPLAGKLAHATAPMAAQLDQPGTQGDVQGNEQVLPEHGVEVAQAIQQAPFTLRHGIQLMAGEQPDAESPECVFHGENP
jgi:hypothetical protein